MPYLFTCPHCQTRTQVDDRYSGQSGQCVSCGKPIQLPRFGDVESPDSSTGGAASSASLRWVIGAFVSVIIIGALLFAMIRIGGQSVGRLTAGRDQTMSIRNLQRIAEAIQAYATDHGTYPPPFTTDDQGAPLHSWRVLILPYLGEDELYNGIDLTRPWDDSINAFAVQQMPLVYAHPNASEHGMLFQSGYYLVTGAGTLFPRSGPLGPSDILDDPTQTILVIAARRTGLSGSWIEPIDVDFTTLQGNIGGDPDTEVGGLLDDGVTMATADGRGHFLPASTDPLILRSLITPRGGERLPDDTLD